MTHQVLASMSRIHRIARRINDDLGENGVTGGDPEHFPSSLGVLDQLNIPYVIYRTSEEANAGSEDFPFLPANVNAEAKQGEIVEIDGVKHVVLENNQNRGVHEMTVAKAELIDINC